MTIKDIKEELKVSNNPVTMSLHNGTAFKVLVVEFKKGMILNESGSSRDCAAKGNFLLGVKAVLAESYERIHRSNLGGM